MTGSVSISRVTRGADLDGILALDQEAFPHPWTRQMYEDDLRNPHSQIWVARSDSGDTVGYCAVWMVMDELHVNNVAVRRDWRGQGLGETLVKHVLTLGAASGARTALLEVRRTNETARRLYARLGFREIGLRKAYYESPVDDAVVLQLSIQPVGASPDA